MHTITQSNLGGGGRLGNMLFGISAIYGTATKLNLTPKIPIWKYAKYFEKQFNFCDDEVTHVYDEPVFHYTPVNLEDAVKVKDGPLVYDLRGYFQSPKYWEGHEQQIKELFTLTEGWKSRVHHLWWVLFQNEPNVQDICSVNIRRGDYVNNNFYTDLTSTFYYEAAMSTLKADKYLIFSDDIEFAKELLKHRKDCIFVEGNSNIEDLFLMTLCEHNIIANSSFSFWGAYLNSNLSKKVIAPKQWFGEKVNFNTNDLIPEAWQRI